MVIQLEDNVSPNLDIPLAFLSRAQQKCVTKREHVVVNYCIHLGQLSLPA